MARPRNSIELVNGQKSAARKADGLQVGENGRARQSSGFEARRRRGTEQLNRLGRSRFWALGS